MNQMLLHAAQRPALSILLTVLTLFAAPGARARDACEAAARKAIYGPLTFKLRDKKVDRSRLQDFSREVLRINAQLKTLIVPKQVTVLTSSFGFNVAAFRAMAIAERTTEFEGKVPIEIWIHEYAHVLFMENLIARFPELADSSFLVQQRKDLLSYARYFELGSEFEGFRRGHQLMNLGLEDEGIAILRQTIGSNSTLFHRYREMDQAFTREDKSREDQLLTMTFPYQEVLADLLPLIALPDGDGRQTLQLQSPFRDFNPAAIAPEEQAAYRKLNPPNFYEVSFEARRHIAKILSRLSDPAERWEYLENLFGLFLNDISHRNQESVLPLPPEEVSRRILKLVKTQRGS